ARVSRMSREPLRQLGYLAAQSAPGTTNVCRCLVDPGLDPGHLGTAPLCLMGAGRTPWLDDPGPLEEQSGGHQAQLGSPSELVSLGEVSGVTLHGCSRPVQIVGSGPQ